MPNSKLIVACPKLKMLQRILERGRAPEISAGMRDALCATDLGKTFAVAVDVKGMMASEEASRTMQQNLGGAAGLQGLNGELIKNVLGFAFDASLDSSRATCNATLMCKEAKVAEDAKKMLEGGQVVLRNMLKGQKDVPGEVPDMVDAIKFTVSGTTLKGYLQTDFSPLTKWIKEQASRSPKVSPRRPARAGQWMGL